jgi:hypothetical protein
MLRAIPSEERPNRPDDGQHKSWLRVFGNSSGKMSCRYRDAVLGFESTSCDSPVAGSSQASCRHSGVNSVARRRLVAPLGYTPVVTRRTLQGGRSCEGKPLTMTEIMLKPRCNTPFTCAGLNGRKSGGSKWGAQHYSVTAGVRTGKTACISCTLPRIPLVPWRCIDMTRQSAQTCTLASSSKRGRTERMQPEAAGPVVTGKEDSCSDS